MTDQQGTTLSEDIARVTAAVRNIWPLFSRSRIDPSRNNLMLVLHTGKNVLVESIRRNSTGWIRSNAQIIANSIIIFAVVGIVGLFFWVKIQY